MLDTQQGTDGQRPRECMSAFTFKGWTVQDLSVSVWTSSKEYAERTEEYGNTVHKYLRRRDIGDQETLLAPLIESLLQPWMCTVIIMWQSVR